MNLSCGLLLPSPLPPSILIRVVLRRAQKLPPPPPPAYPEPHHFLYTPKYRHRLDSYYPHKILKLDTPRSNLQRLVAMATHPATSPAPSHTALATPNMITTSRFLDVKITPRASFTSLLNILSTRGRFFLLLLLEISTAPWMIQHMLVAALCTTGVANDCRLALTRSVDLPHRALQTRSVVRMLFRSSEALDIFTLECGATGRTSR